MATVAKPRPLNKADLKRLAKRFREEHRWAFRSIPSMSGTVWWDFDKRLDEVLEIGFTGVRRAEAMATLREALDELYEERFSETYSHAYTARTVYAFFTDKLEPYGIEDKREAAERALDDEHVERVDGRLQEKWRELTDEGIAHLLSIVEKEPIDLTDEDLAFLARKDVTVNPYGDAAPSTLRDHDREIAAIERVAADFSNLSTDVQMLLGSPDRLMSRKHELLEGPRSSMSFGSMLGIYKGYRGRYEQARDLLQEELADRRVLTASRVALRQASEARK